MNALLQALSVLTGFWSARPALASEEQDISPLVTAYCQIMFLLKLSKNPVDPSCFLDAFSRFMVSKERGGFVVNSQQDVPEVLNYLLDNFCGISVLAQDQIRVIIRKRITCMNCLRSDDKEDIHMIVKLNVAKNVKNVNTATNSTIFTFAAALSPTSSFVCITVHFRL